MSEAKRYYWLKLKENFFDEKYIKALRRLPEGDSQVIVYLKMQLKSLKTAGIIEYENILPDSIDELAMAIDENADIVKTAVDNLIKFGVVERWDNDVFYMTAMQKLIGSESDVTERVRKHREQKKLKSNDETLQCNTAVTKCNTEIDIEIDKRYKSKDIIPPKVPQGDKSGFESKSNACRKLFDDFWEAYPKKVSKANAIKAWNKLKPNDDTVRLILSALEKQKMSSQWQKEDGQFVPYPSTWLNGKRWEDNITIKSDEKEEYSYNLDDYKAFTNNFEDWNK